MNNNPEETTEMLVTTESVRDYLRSKAGSDQINPVNESGQCLYNSDDGTHCIAGEYFITHNMPTPPEHAGVLEAIHKGVTFEDDWKTASHDGNGALSLLMIAQTLADGHGMPNGSRIGCHLVNDARAPRRWCEVVSFMKMLGKI